MATAVVAGVVLGRLNRAIGFALAAAAVAFVPVSNLLFTTGTVMAERLAYLPSVEVVAALVAVAAWLLGRIPLPPTAVAAIVGGVVIALAAASIARNRVWRDEVTLWTAAVEAVPRSFKAHGALAEALYDADSSRLNLPAVIEHKVQSLACWRAAGCESRARTVPRSCNLLSRPRRLAARARAGARRRCPRRLHRCRCL